MHQSRILARLMALAAAATMIAAMLPNVALAAAATSLTVQASPDVPFGGSISAQGLLSGATTDATGTINFRIWGPDDGNCDQGHIFDSPIAVSGNALYQSDSFAPSQAGTYRWIAYYSGDSNNNFTQTTCNAPGSSVVVGAGPNPSPSPTPGVSPGPTVEPTPQASDTPGPSAGPSSSPLPGPSETAQASATPGPTVEPTPQASDTPGPSQSPQSSSTPGPTAGPTATPTPVPTANPNPSPDAAAGSTAYTTTDSESNGATTDDPVETGVQWPSGVSSGTTTIAETGTITQTPPSGYSLFGQQVDISAPSGSAADPLSIAFTLDATIIPAGVNETNAVVLRNGTPVPDCDPAFSGIAAPDPCVHTRIRTFGGDIVLGIYTSAASHWNFGQAPALHYTFNGFEGLAMPPGSNSAKAGSKIDLVFSLGSDQGLDIFAQGFPMTQAANCVSFAPVGPTTSVADGKKGLVYKGKKKNQYAYTWETPKSWAGSCQILTMRFKDGSETSVRFKFTK